MQNKLTITAGEDQELHIPYSGVTLSGRIEGNNSGNRLKCHWDLISSPATSADAKIMSNDNLTTFVVFNSNYLPGQKFIFKLTVWGEDGKEYFDNIKVTIMGRLKGF